MKITKPALLLLALFMSIYSNAVLAPVTPTASVIDPFKMKPREIEKITGKKLTLFQKIKLTIAQKALKRYSSNETTPRQKKQARWSMILGFLGLVLVILAVAPSLGFLALLSIPAAIAAIVVGAKSLRGNKNTEGKLGVITGGVTIVFILLVMMLVFLTLSVA